MWGSLRRGGARAHALVWGQALLAVSFYLLLVPPSLRVRSDTLTVLTPGASSEQVRGIPRDARVVALPDAPPKSGATRWPDLASALRAFPEVRNVNIVGAGLPPRDQEAVAGRGVSFAAAPEHGLVELSSPPVVQLGAQWTLSGRVAARGASVELLDPSAKIIDAAKADDDGRFRLSAQARGSGPVRFELHVLDERRRIVDSAAVPVVVRTGETIAIIVRAGAPDPELKYFRRWAADAGLNVRSSAGLSTDLTLRDGDARLTPDALARADLVVVDDRAWLTLTADEKAALRSAVDDGLGVLLRVGGRVDDAVATEWLGYGYGITPADAPQTVTLDRRLLTHERSAFTAAPVAVQQAGAVPMLASDDSGALAWWRAEGRGRVGLWILTDSYRLMLLGESARYGTLWSDAIATLARARSATPGPTLPDVAWVGERAVLCGLGTTARAIAPDGKTTALIVAGQACAAYWPSAPGWHAVSSGGESGVFYVRPAGDGQGLRAARNRHATERLLRPAESSSAPALRRDIPMSRWPFFALWLFIAVGVWWWERSR
jgi:hypothetical protein